MTIILCPDNNCQLFFKTGEFCPCETQCPRVNEMQKQIICGGCNKPITLSGSHNQFCRVDCADCGAANFQRMSGKYKLERIKQKNP